MNKFILIKFENLDKADKPLKKYDLLKLSQNRNMAQYL